jgi:phage gpG-like protein
MGGGRLLVLSGQLKSAATNPGKQLGNGSDSGPGQSSGDAKTSLTMTLSVNDPKAATHEFGRGNIPARPFFTVTGQAKEDLRKIVQVALFKAVMG